MTFKSLHTQIKMAGKNNDMLNSLKNFIHK